MSTLEKALEIAFVAHKGQKDKSGADYILHPIRVMQRGKTEIEKICGLLHDVVEDSDLTFEDLENEGFSKDVISVLKCLTKTSENEDYDSFIDRVIQNPIAIKVKINDLLDNMDITRLRELSERDLKRLNKYLKAYSVLKGYISESD
jgi:(p)ppGpp synthase/HD superfamily hydrolase